MHSRRSRALSARLARFAAVAGVCALLPSLALAAEPGSTPLERAASTAASEIAGKPVQVRCHDAASWAAITTERRVDPQAVGGFAQVGGTVAELAPHVCAALDDLWTGSPPACKLYVPYTVTVRRAEWVSVKRRVRVRVGGKLVWRMRTVRVRQVVPRKVQRERYDPAPCQSVSDHAIAIKALAHEAWHLAGYRDEAVADCYALQRVAAVASSLGAPDAPALVARALLLYRGRATTAPAYYSPECRAGGALDLSPADSAWP